MELSYSVLIYAFPALLMFAGLEALYIVFIKKEIYAWRESVATLGVAVGGRLFGLITAGGVAFISTTLWNHRLLNINEQHILYWPSLFILEELAYYWFHRMSHTIRWFWATHAVHHSPQHFYLSGAYRLGWTGQITGGFLFFSPLFLLGFKPSAVFGVLAINLLYQYWLHTELIGRLGWFDRVFNSPSNHRVHHATHLQYLDKNFGGVIMLFDHLFGTYAAENQAQPVKDFGLIPNIHTHNPIKIAFHEWMRIYDEMRTRSNLLERLRVLVGKP